MWWRWCGHDAKEFFEPLLILLIVILNAILGVFQENKAESPGRLKKPVGSPGTGPSGMAWNRSSMLPRWCRETSSWWRPEILSLPTPGFSESASLKSEESALTGESVPAEKDAAASVEENAPLGDRINMMYSGCSVTYGRAKGVVTATGMDTEMGKIAGLLEGEEETQTPLTAEACQAGQISGHFWPWAYAPLSLWWVSSTASP